MTDVQERLFQNYLYGFDRENVDADVDVNVVDVDVVDVDVIDVVNVVKRLLSELFVRV